MELEKNYQQDADYIESIKKEQYVIEKFEAFDRDYAKDIISKALFEEWVNCENDEEKDIKRIKIIRIYDEIINKLYS